jgi:tetratricopeptide (TPR) repeat protein
MSNIAKLKKKAAEFELKKQPDKALAAYIELLGEYEHSPEEMDVALFNRVGDMLLKAGNVADAVDYYEKAVDYYADGGFFNNAIALCNKILRQSPGRTSVYYKLGKISAQKGFVGDAKRNYLEYADRVQKSGKITEAFRALKEFADLCPDQDDIRLMLADQLLKAGKDSEAVEQLQLLYSRYESEGRSGEAEATAARIRSIDPSAKVKSEGRRRQTKASDLVFLDLDEGPSVPGRKSRTPAPFKPASETPSSPPPRQPVQASPARSVPAQGASETPAGPLGGLIAISLEGVVRTNAEGVEAIAEGPPLADLQSTSLDAAPTDAAPARLADFEPTSLGFAPTVPETPAFVPTPGPTLALTAEPEPAPAEQPPVEPPAATELVLELEPDFGDGSGGTEFQEQSVAPSDVRSATDLLIHPTPSDGLIGHSPIDGLPLLESPAPSAMTPSDVAEVAVEDESLEEAAPEEPADTGELVPGSVGRSSTLLAVKSVEMLHAVVEGAPGDWEAHRELGEAMLDAGDRDGGLRELEAAMLGYERENELDPASAIADEIARVDPNSIKHHQKRVEYAFRMRDERRLVDAYLELADALFRGEQPEKARVIYQRVLDLAPDDLRAQAAIGALPEPAPPEAPPVAHGPPGAQARSTVSLVNPAPPSASAAPTTDGTFVNLGDWLREEEQPKDTRMVVAEEEPTGDEEADFADMLRKFKQGVAENVGEEDHQSHYDLGIAYKEMGLLDDAIAQFQKALRGADNHVRVYEAIGQCFMEKRQYQMAATLLARALAEKGTADDKLVGVLYLLARASEELDRVDEALTYYQRVFVVDIQFRDVAERMNAIENAAR